MTQRVQDSGENRSRRLLRKEMLVQAAGSRGPSTPQTPLRMTQRKEHRFAEILRLQQVPLRMTERRKKEINKKVGKKTNPLRDKF